MRWPRLDMRGFRTVLGRRIVLLFVISALVPTLALSLDAYRRVSSELEDQAWARLGQSAKAAGMSLVERLRAADAELDLVGRQVAAPGRVRTLELLREVELVQDGSVRSLAGPRFSPPPLTPALRARLAAGEAVLVLQPAAGAARILLGRAAPGAGVLWGVVSTEAMLSIARVYMGAENGERYCVLAGTMPVAGCDQLPPATLRQATTGERRSRLRVGGRELLASRWDVFLRPIFGIDSWSLLLTTDARTQLASVTLFRRSLLRVLLLSLGVVLLLSHRQIRRSLRPLERLRDAARRLGTRDFATRVSVHSGDEFEEVADAFNRMARELGRQFAALDTINRLDRTVLATLDRTRVEEELIARADSVAAADALLLLSWDPDQPGRAQMLAASRDAPESRVSRALELGPGEMQVLAAAARDGAGAALPPAIEAELAGLTGGAGSRLLLPLGRPAGRGLLVLASREAGAYDADDRLRGGQLADQLAVVLRTVDLFADRVAMMDGALLALGRAIDAKSSWTAGHSERVAELSATIGRELQLDERELERIYRGSLLHDLGKIGIPGALLDKPARATPEEFELLRTHVAAGVRILEPIAAFADILPVVAQHHERWDGSGYPAGLRAEQIHPLARIVAVADVFDSMVSDRPYRTAFSVTHVREYLRQGAGSHFAADVVAAFLRVAPVEVS